MIAFNKKSKPRHTTKGRYYTKPYGVEFYHKHSKKLSTSYIEERYGDIVLSKLYMVKLFRYYRMEEII